MDFEAVSSNLSPIIKKYWLALGLGGLGLIFFIYGLISLLGLSGTPGDNDVIPFSQEKTASKSANLIYVDVEGAVVSPGVYKLNYGSIIQDALVSSKGLSADADRDYVSKNINLAGKLTDGAKIYIPAIGETPQEQETGQSGQEASGLININNATGELLDSLPGVGPVTSQKIIENRPYQTIDDLQNKKVVSAKVFSQIKDKITVY